MAIAEPLNIFLTVGAQMPFDRLVRAVEAWAADNPDSRIVAQVGPGGYLPANMEASEFIEPDQYKTTIAASDLIISHAGMGSIITALQYCKPIVIMPRLGELRETRNDHQLATTERFGSKPGIRVAKDEADLRRVLDDPQLLENGDPVSPYASETLISKIREFLQ